MSESDYYLCFTVKGKEVCAFVYIHISLNLFHWQSVKRNFVMDLDSRESLHTCYVPGPISEYQRFRNCFKYGCMTVLLEK